MKRTFITMKEFALYLKGVAEFINKQNGYSDKVFALSHIANLPCSFERYTALTKDTNFEEVEANPLIMEFYKDHSELENFFSGHVVLHIIYALEHGLLTVSVAIIKPGDVSQKRPQLLIGYREIEADDEAVNEKVKTLYWLLADTGLLECISAPFDDNLDRNCFVFAHKK